MTDSHYRCFIIRDYEDNTVITNPKTEKPAIGPPAKAVPPQLEMERGVLPLKITENV
jgi:hypothetical protein